MKLFKNLTLFSVGLTFLILALGACQSQYKFRGTPVDPPEAAPDFTLTDVSGQSFRLGAQQGKVVLLYFGYTHCPDACPLTLAKLAQAMRTLGPDSNRVRVVFVTTDPERDTAQVLKDYLAKFDSSFVGLSGDWAAISPILQKYYAASMKQEPAGSNAGYTVDHTTYVYAIDRKLEWRALYPQDAQVDAIVSDVQYLLRESN